MSFHPAGLIGVGGHSCGGGYCTRQPHFFSHLILLHQTSRPAGALQSITNTNPTHVLPHWCLLQACPSCTPYLTLHTARVPEPTSPKAPAPAPLPHTIRPPLPPPVSEGGARCCGEGEAPSMGIPRPLPVSGEVRGRAAGAGAPEPEGRGGASLCAGRAPRAGMRRGKPPTVGRDGGWRPPGGGGCSRLHPRRVFPLASLPR